MQQMPVWGTVKLKNQKLVLDMLRRAPTSRMELARRLGMTRPAMTQIVDSLLGHGLVQECDTVATDRGRHPTLLQLQADARYAVGVNIKRGRIHVGIMDLAGGKVAQQVLAPSCQPAQACGHIAACIHALLQQQNIPLQRVVGIGVCAPGPLDAAAGTLLAPPNFAAWHGFPVVAELLQYFSCPIFLENVSNALAVEEKYYGVARDLQDFIVIQINEGIGAGIFMHDTLYRGAHGLGAEVGHTSIYADGRLCDCGNRGCLECYAAIPAILQGSGFISWAQLVDSLPDPASVALLQQEAAHLAAAFVTLLNLFDPARLILLGDVTHRPAPLLQAIQAQLAARGVDGHTWPDLLVCGTSTCDFRAAATVCMAHYFEDLTLPLD